MPEFRRETDDAVPCVSAVWNVMAMRAAMKPCGLWPIRGYNQRGKTSIGANIVSEPVFVQDHSLAGGSG